MFLITFPNVSELGDSGIACDAKLTINNAQCTIGMVS